MRGLEDCNVIANVAGCREPKAAHQPGEGIGENVPEQVRGHDHVVLFRILIQPHQLRVDVRGPERNAGIILRDFLGDFFHHAGGFPHHVGLLADGHPLEAALLRILERGGDNACRGSARDDAAADSQFRAGDISKCLEPRVAV